FSAAVPRKCTGKPSRRPVFLRCKQISREGHQKNPLSRSDTTIDAGASVEAGSPRSRGSRLDDGSSASQHKGRTQSSIREKPNPSTYLYAGRFTRSWVDSTSRSGCALVHWIWPGVNRTETSGSAIGKSETTAGGTVLSTNTAIRLGSSPDDFSNESNRAM